MALEQFLQSVKLQPMLHRPRRLVDASGTPPAPGALVSLLPIGAPAHGVTTTGLRWPLADATLSPGDTVWAELRGKRLPVAVSPLPFHQPGYKR